MLRFQSTKLFTNFSIAIRQHKAKHSHCQLIHGYAYKFHVTFESVEQDIDKQLDEMNWIMDFGGFKSQPIGNGLKDWLNQNFDHTLLIESDDPHKDIFEQLGTMGIAKPIFLDKIGAEFVAKLVFDKFNDVLSKTNAGRCKVVRVECFENECNSGICTE